MPLEISGDARLTAMQRLRYLALNLARNIGDERPTSRPESFCHVRLPHTPASASPSRALTDAFLDNRLPGMLLPAKVRVLEIGCGSGSLARRLAESGYSGKYVGVDIVDRFDNYVQSGFDRTFILADANNLELDGKFDLVVSVSALEHIPEDRRLLAKLNGFVAPGGLQLHFVPSGWGLLTYLWHGYRQYTLVSIDARFDSQRTSIFAMGGAASFVLHLLFITVGEILLRLRLRQRFPWLYGRMLDACLRFDRLVPVCATMYAVCQTSASVNHNTND